MERQINYRYVVNEEKGVVVALSSFAGKDVRGVARCSPNDNFNVESGKKLAVARCDTKISQKRVERATRMVEFYTTLLAQVQDGLKNAEQYLVDSVEQYSEDLATLETIENSL